MSQKGYEETFGWDTADRRPGSHAIQTAIRSSLKSAG